jgi:hypothetical protein
VSWWHWREAEVSSDHPPFAQHHHATTNPNRL